jgi:hypothetical protein
MSSPGEKQPEAPVSDHVFKPQSDPGASGTAPTGGTLLYLAADLIWATRIKETATSLGIPARPVRTLDMLEARLADILPPGRIAGLIIDLEAGDVGLEMVHRLRSADVPSPHSGAIPILAFGPHVAVERLQSAARAGASAVMARGAFASQLPAILTALAHGQAGALKTRLTD